LRPIQRKSQHTVGTNHERRIEALERRYDRKGFYEIKLAPDDAEPDLDVFIFTIPDDLDKTFLTYAEAFVTDTGSTATIIQINNRTQTVDMLLDRIQVDANELDSRTSSAPSDIDPDNNQVDAQDQIAVELDQKGSGAFGTGVTLRFS
jgi:hypothetical protein